MASNALRSVEVSGLHDGTGTISIRLQPGLNILYGRNGSGKTTLLHIVANLLESDISRFCHLNFHRIRFEAFDNTVVELESLPHGPNEVAPVRVQIDGETLAHVQDGEETPSEVRQVLRVCFGGQPVYLPAFRSVLEAIGQDRVHDRIDGTIKHTAEFARIVSREQGETARTASDGVPKLASIYLTERAKNIAAKTMLCREWFGSFVPIVRFPSLWEVAEELSREIQNAEFRIAMKDREAFSDVFVRVLRTVLSRPDNAGGADVSSLLSSIRESLSLLQSRGIEAEGAYSEIASLVKDHEEDVSIQETIATRILQLYAQALNERIEAEEDAFAQIRNFQASVNRFLRDKSLDFDSRVAHRLAFRRSFGKQMIKFPNGHRTSLSVLSSGERHVLALLFSATHMSSTDGILLIDEPELSLHVDWQRHILSELKKQAGDRQIIACTHAPEVTAEHRHSMVKIQFSKVRSAYSSESALDFDPEL